jgi:hypothetical protein
MIAVWRGVAFAIAPVVLGVFGFQAQLIGAALALPLYVRAVAETQTVSIGGDPGGCRWCSMPPPSPTTPCSSTELALAYPLRD